MTKTNSTQDMFSHLSDINDNSGFEDINLQSMAIPFIRLVQDLSPIMKKTKPEYNPEAETGMFYNTVSGKLYGTSLKVIVGRFERIFLEWGTTRGKLLGVHSPEVVELNQKLMRDEKNQLVDPTTGSTFQDTYTYYVVLPEHLEEGICIVSLASTNIKEAKKLNRNLTHTILPNSNKRAMPYFMVWEMSSSFNSNDQGDWYTASFKFDSFVTQLQLEAVVEERQQIPNKTVDYAQLEDLSAKDEQTKF